MSIKIGTARILQRTNVNELCDVSEGYVIRSIPAQQFSVGSVYQKGNESRSFHNLSNLGTFMGQLPLEGISINNINNFLTCLIPGVYPNISGKWKHNIELYDLKTIQQTVQNNQDEFFCKILGMGLGTINNYQVSDVSRSGINSIAYNTPELDPLGSSISFPLLTSALRLTNYSNIVDGMIDPLTTVGEGFYMSGFDWQSYYNIEMLNGTNTFPFMGFAGERIGSIKPENFQFQQNTLYNYPSAFLILAKSYNPIGIIYAGQGVQINSFPTQFIKQYFTFEDRNDRTYQESIDPPTSDIRFTGIVPYQQGRGSWDFFTNDVLYNKQTGIIDKLDRVYLLGSEGAQPGRNSGFLGVVLTDFWKENININNIEAGSITPQDTRYDNIGINKQTQTAHNSPLVYTTVSDENNTNNPLPWSSLFAYMGNSTANTCNTQTSNAPILTEGLTTMVISGAYPIYRGSWNTKWSGNGQILFNNFGSVPLDQYYFSTEFWDPKFIDPGLFNITNITSLPSVPPNPPYRIKGGRIVLFEGQRVKAGSYVYSTINSCGNVGMSQFLPPAAKDIVLSKSERNQLLEDVYSKYQFNQGGIIVMVSIDGQRVPMPPSCCVPIGIVMEDVIGYGQPNYNDGLISQNTKYDTKYTIDGVKYTQLSMTPTNVNIISSREIIIKLFPMYPQFSLSACGTTNFNFFLSLSSSFPINTAYGDLTNTQQIPGFETQTTFTPLTQRIKTNYIGQAGLGMPITNSSVFNSVWGLRAKELVNEFQYLP